MVEDVNGDGRADIIAFGYAGVYVSYSTGTGFTAPSLKLSKLGYSAGGWRVSKHPRIVADANGDGKADIIGFGYAGAYVSYSTGTGFTSPSLKLSSFGYDSGWRIDKHPRIMADMNGDGRADIVGFGNAGAYISYSTGSGYSFAQLKVNTYGYIAGGWRIDQHPRMTGDMNGNGIQEIVGFASTGVYIAKETCSAQRQAEKEAASTELQSKLPPESDELKISPNPVISQATIQFRIDRADEVDLAVYNLQGQKIEHLIVRENFPEGTHSVDFEPDGKLAKGIYLIVLTTGTDRITEKMMIR